VHSRSSILIIRLINQIFVEIPSNINSTLSEINANAIKRTSFSLTKAIEAAIDAHLQVRPLILLVRNVLYLDSGRVTNVFALLHESGMEKNAYAQHKQYGMENNVLVHSQKSFKKINVYVLHLKFCKVTTVCILLDIVAKINVPALKIKF